MSNRLEQQLHFVLEIDRLKQILRQTLVSDGSRRENSAEHSWHLAMMAILLCEYSNQFIDTLRTVKMLLIHDLVEIDAGDTYCYDEAAMVGKEERERCAAERIFGLLPSDQSGEIRALWDEFEARRTPESKFANALDRLQPVLLNFHTQGRAWKEHGITLAQVLSRNTIIEEGSEALWKHVRALFEQAVELKYLKP
jgi:putative hydrolase of HD superfamily